MKCIGNKCDYYGQHDFNESWDLCAVDCRSIKKDVANKCYIEDEIRAANAYIEQLEDSLSKIVKINESEDQNGNR